MTHSIPDIPDFDPDDVVDSEVIDPPPITNENSLVRRVALQVLYEIDSADHKVGTVLGQQVQYYAHDLTNAGRVYLHKMVTHIIQRRKQYDLVISRYAPEFPVEQLAIVDRNVLRIALYEIVTDNARVPAKVAIDEAVELAKLFGAEGSARFINGVLGAVMQDQETVMHLLTAEDDAV